MDRGICGWHKLLQEQVQTQRGQLWLAQVVKGASAAGTGRNGGYLWLMQDVGL